MIKAKVSITFHMRIMRRKRNADGATSAFLSQ